MPQEGKLFVFDRMWQLTAWTPELLCGKSATREVTLSLPRGKGAGLLLRTRDFAYFRLKKTKQRLRK